MSCPYESLNGVEKYENLWFYRFIPFYFDTIILPKPLNRLQAS